MTIDKIKLTEAQIKAEQDMLLKYDRIFFMAPMQWFDIPAIGRYWIEQVFAMDFAYKMDQSAG